MKSPIKYTIENIDGKHHVSDSFEINDKIELIRIIIKHPIYERNPITRIIKNISNKEQNIHFDDSQNSWNGQCSTITDLKVDEFVNNTNDIKFKLLENSKIELHIFKEYGRIGFLGNASMPDIFEFIKK